MSNFANYIIIPELRLLVSYYSGSITLKDLIHLNELFIKDDLFDSSYDALVDFRDSKAIGFRVDISEYFNFIKSKVSFSKQIQNGILYSTTNQKYLINIFRTFSKVIKINTEGFVNIENYFEWMGYNEMQKRILLNALDSLKNATENKLKN